MKKHLRSKVVLSVVFLIVLLFLLWQRQQHFDSMMWKEAAWKTGVGPHSAARLAMVDDLLKRYKLIGMTRAQVVDLLGPPSPIESNQSDSVYIYYLGPERGFISIDDEWLDIKFGGDRVVSAVDRTD